MKNNYVHYDNITKEILDTIKVGDFIKVNDWKKPMTVKAVSDNYFVMTQNLFGKIYYSVVSKLPWDGIRYNNMVGGKFHCSTDDYVFGSPLSAEYENFYKFENEEANQKYLQSFENNECSLSQRNAIPINDLYVKKMQS